MLINGREEAFLEVPEDTWPQLDFGINKILQWFDSMQVWLGGCSDLFSSIFFFNHKHSRHIKISKASLSI